MMELILKWSNEFISPNVSKICGGSKHEKLDGEFIGELKHTPFTVFLLCDLYPVCYVTIVQS